MVGLGVGAGGGLIFGGVVVGNLVGFPEVEAAEGIGLLGFGGLESLNTIASGGFLGGSLFGSLGLVTGLGSTNSMCGGGQ